MEQELKSELERIISAVEFVAGQSFSFAGKKSDPLPVLPQDGPPQPVEMPPLVAQLQQYLYSYCYMRRFDGSAPERKAVMSPTDGEFVEQLSRANTSRDIRDEGWTIYDFLQTGQVLVQKHNLFRAMWPG